MQGSRTEAIGTENTALLTKLPGKKTTHVLGQRKNTCVSYPPTYPIFWPRP